MLITVVSRRQSEKKEHEMRWEDCSPAEMEIRIGEHERHET